MGDTSLLGDEEIIGDPILKLVFVVLWYLSSTVVSLSTLYRRNHH